MDHILTITLDRVDDERVHFHAQYKSGKMVNKVVSFKPGDTAYDLLMNVLKSMDAT